MSNFLLIRRYFGVKRTIGIVRHKKITDTTDEYDPPIVPDSIPCDSIGGTGWRPIENEVRPGYAVPTQFRVALPQKIVMNRKIDVTYSRDTSSHYTYSDYCGLRFPTLDTSKNTNYWSDTGLNRLLPRVFPIKLPTHKKVDPLMREYMHFLHTLDPYRFTIKRISKRYGFKESTVSKIIKEYSLLHFIKHNRLCDLNDRRITLEEARLLLKEAAYKDHIGYIHTSNEADDDQYEFQGHKDTFDWIYRQSIQVESLSAFPLPSTRDPMPKRVDVDLTVKNTKNVKVINWIDPSDKVVV